jgi:lysine 2,3-aminomutase
MPMKLITHTEWLDALTSIVERGRKIGKEVVLHTHFNAPEEITWITQKAMRLLFERGIFTRNQSVLIRGVNDTRERMQLLTKRLGHVNVHPYYVYMHDMVKGVEELRTTIATAVDTEKFVRGSTAGFNTPTFVCDAPGGGGKRDVHSYEYYDRNNGIAVYAAPSVKPGKAFLYFDPIDQLDAQAQARWAVPDIADQMIREAIGNAGLGNDQLVLA